MGKMTKYYDDSLESLGITYFKSPRGKELWEGPFHILDSEHLARWDACDMMRCSKCGNEYRKNSWCEKCHWSRRKERFENFPSESWNGEGAVALFDDDRFFFSWDEVEEYCEEEDCQLKDLMLVHCRRVEFPYLELDELWCDYLPNDSEPAEYIPQEVLEWEEKINRFLDSYQANLWEPIDLKVDV